MNTVGRPFNEQALRRAGKRIIFLLKTEDVKILNDLTKRFGLTTSEFLRRLIKLCNRQNKEV